MQLVLHAPFGSRDQQGVEPRAAQALLPAVQLRAAGGGHGGRAAAVARSAALVPACRRLPLSASGDRARRADPGVPRRAGLPDALALEHHDFARRPAQPRRQEGAAAAPAHAGRRSRWPPSSPTRRRVSKTFPATGRFPITRWSRRPSAIASKKRWTSTRSPRCWRGFTPARSAAWRAIRAEPSPLSHEILNAQPYAFMDDAPLEERRTQAVYTRRAGEPRRRTTSARSIRTRSTRVQRGGAPGSAGRRRTARRAADGRLPDRGRDARDPRRAVSATARVASRDAISPQSPGASVANPRAAPSGAPAAVPVLWIAAERLPELRAVHPGCARRAGDRRAAIARGARLDARRGHRRAAARTSGDRRADDRAPARRPPGDRRTRCRRARCSRSNPKGWCCAGCSKT